MSDMDWRGWIKVWRKLQEGWLWEDKPFSKGQAWIDLLFLANHEDHKMPYRGQVILCKRGDVNRSVSWLADRWGWGRKKARDFLKLLESDNMVTIDASTHRTTITIENYDKYQGVGTTNEPMDDTTKEQQRNSKGTTKEQQGNTYKNDKNEKNAKNGKNISAHVRGRELLPVYEDAPPELHEAMKGFEEMRKKIKSPLTERAFRQVMKKVNDLSGGDIGKCIEILDQSTMNGWKSVYALKEEKIKPEINIWDC